MGNCDSNRGNISLFAFIVFLFFHRGIFSSNDATELWPKISENSLHPGGVRQDRGGGPTGEGGHHHLGADGLHAPQREDARNIPPR